MIQIILIMLIFTGALVYLIFMIRNQFISKQNGCPKGCGCGAMDLEKLEKEMQKSSLK